MAWEDNWKGGVLGIDFEGKWEGVIDHCKVAIDSRLSIGI